MSLTPKNTHQVAQRQRGDVVSGHQTTHSDSRRIDMIAPIMKRLCLAAMLFGMIATTASAQMTSVLIDPVSGNLNLR